MYYWHRYRRQCVYCEKYGPKQISYLLITVVYRLMFQNQLGKSTWKTNTLVDFKMWHVTFHKILHVRNRKDRHIFVSVLNIYNIRHAFRRFVYSCYWLYQIRAKYDGHLTFVLFIARALDPLYRPWNSIPLVCRDHSFISILVSLPSARHLSADDLPVVNRLGNPSAVTKWLASMQGQQKGEPDFHKLII